MIRTRNGIEQADLQAKYEIEFIVPWYGVLISKKAENHESERVCSIRSFINEIQAKGVLFRCCLDPKH